MNSSKDTSVTDIRTHWWCHSRSAETCRDSVSMVFTFQCL